MYVCTGHFNKQWKYSKLDNMIVVWVLFVNIFTHLKMCLADAIHNFN